MHMYTRIEFRARNGVSAAALGVDVVQFVLSLASLVLNAGESCFWDVFTISSVVIEACYVQPTTKRCNCSLFENLDNASYAPPGNCTTAKDVL